MQRHNTERAGRPDDIADELTAATNAEWSSLERKRRAIAAELIRRRLLKLVPPIVNDSSEICCAAAGRLTTRPTRQTRTNRFR